MNMPHRKFNRTENYLNLIYLLAQSPLKAAGKSLNIKHILKKTLRLQHLFSCKNNQ